MTLDVTIQNSVVSASVSGGSTQVTLGATAPVTVTIGTFLPVPGPAGAGVPTGGTGGQVLAKTSGVDYATAWITNSLTRYTHTQASSSASWVVNHNLGYRPTVAVFSAGGVEVEATITHNSVNQTTISFNTAVTGTATFL